MSNAELLQVVSNVQPVLDFTCAVCAFALGTIMVAAFGPSVLKAVRS
jgi:hypothetical protein